MMFADTLRFLSVNDNKILRTADPFLDIFEGWIYLNRIYGQINQPSPKDFVELLEEESEGGGEANYPLPKKIYPHLNNIFDVRIISEASYDNFQEPVLVATTDENISQTSSQSSFRRGFFRNSTKSEAARPRGGGDSGRISARTESAVAIPISEQTRIAPESIRVNSTVTRDLLPDNLQQHRPHHIRHWLRVHTPAAASEGKTVRIYRVQLDPTDG